MLKSLLRVEGLMCVQKNKKKLTWPKPTIFLQHRLLNPVIPKSDQHLLSPHNIMPESHIKVMRIKEMITK